jgi:hypothetical protein
MSFFSWLRSSTSKRIPRNRTRRRPTTAPFRPRLEALEGRDVPSTLHVTSTQDRWDPGIPITGLTLRSAIDGAQSGDTIVFDFDPNLGAQTITLDVEEELQITRNLTIQGPGASLLTISGGSDFGSRLFEIEGAATTVSLSGLSLVGGIGVAYDPDNPNVGWGGGHSGGTGRASDGQGGAIWNGGVLTVSGCTLSNNRAGDPYSDWRDNNAVFYGGAIYNAGTLTVSGSTLSNNTAGDYFNSGPGASICNGGAIYNAGTLTVSGSTLSNNTAGNFYGETGDGGAIYNTGTLTVANSTLSFNTAISGTGGAIYNGSKATVTASTLSANSASYGGGVYTYGTLTVSGSTVSGNTASQGGGIYSSSKGGKLAIGGSLFSNNAPDNVFGSYVDKRGNTFL